MAVPKGGVPRREPAVDNRNDDTAATAFIAGASGKEVYPWQRPGVRNDLGKQTNVTMPERLMMQIEWLSNSSKSTKKAVIERALREYVERELCRLGIEP